MKKIIRLTERDLTRLVKRTIMEMESSDLQSQFESMVDEIGYQVIEDSFYGDLTEDDMEGFASIVSDLVNDKIQEINPNMKVDYTIYHGGDLEFFIFDNDQEEIVATYKPGF
jgi:hypothetical protein